MWAKREALKEINGTNAAARIALSTPKELRDLRIKLGEAVDRELRISRAVQAAAADRVVEPERDSTGMSKGADRRAAVDGFILKCNAEGCAGVKRKHIWLAVGHKSARQFEYWQASDSENTTGADERNFGRIMNMEPAAFIALLKKQNLF
jgi:hypothetical protein